MLVPIFHEFCRILNWFCLFCHILRHKNINYRQHFLIQIYSFQLILLTGACRKSQIWWPGTWCCYSTKEVSRFRNKVPKIILAEKNVETFNTFLGYAIPFKHMLQTCFKVISQNCETGFPFFLWISLSFLDFGHFFLILLSWLRYHVQCHQ